MKKSVFTLIVVFVLTMSLSTFAAPPSQVQAVKTIKVGALFPVTGTWNATGTAAEKAVNAALPIVNQYLSDSGIKIALDIRDTKSDPANALKELEALKNEGVNVVIGPMLSEESINVLQYANENDMLLLSPSSTARELSQPDNFFRMVGTDTSQVDGLTRIMKSVYKMDHVITVYVDDTYGRGYHDYINEMAQKQGMDVIGAVTIASDNPDYVAVAASLKEIAARADSQNTAVVIISPSQTGAEVIKKVAGDAKLSTMKWFASADIIGNQTILQDKDAAVFLEKTGMEGLTMGDKGISLDALPYISSLLDGATDYSPYAITTWDALWLLADTYSYGADVDFNTLKQNLVTSAATYRNAYGSFNTMDANGDTKGSKYMRYICVKDGENYTWSCKGHYVNLGAGEPIILSKDWKVATDGGNVQIGALLPLTGNRSENGKEIKNILEYAVKNFNAYAKSVGSDLELSLVVEDTASDTQKAKEAAQKLIDRGVKNIIGPINSTELEAVKPLIDAAGVIDISPLSSSASLIQPDRIYRLVMNDEMETKAMSALMKQEGIEKLVILHTDDTYGNGIIPLMQKNFGGEVISVAYDPAAVDFSDVIKQTEAAVTGSDPAKTSVMTVSYSEVVKILASVGESSVLKDVKWFGTDSSSQSKTVVADKTAAEMATRVDYTTIDFTPYGDKFDPLYYVINDEVGNGTALKESIISSFDGIWLLGCAYLSEGTSADLEKINTYVGSNSFHGVGGVLNLDKNGDRKLGYYKFYHLVTGDTGYTWESDGQYSQDLLKPGVLEMK
ncbi:MAG: penicillin-binding protein activator [Acetobacterium woodii]|nr:penicillin-binding protein activator [Acetobacterium woodii]